MFSPCGKALQGAARELLGRFMLRCPVGAVGAVGGVVFRTREESHWDDSDSKGCRLMIIDIQQSATVPTDGSLDGISTRRKEQWKEAAQQGFEERITAGMP